jgi:hypothetical protein
MVSGGSLPLIRSSSTWAACACSVGATAVIPGLRISNQSGSPYPAGSFTRGMGLNQMRGKLGS